MRYTVNFILIEEKLTFLCSFEIATGPQRPRGCRRVKPCGLWWKSCDFWYRTILTLSYLISNLILYPAVSSWNIGAVIINTVETYLYVISHQGPVCMMQALQYAEELTGYSKGKGMKIKNIFTIIEISSDRVAYFLSWFLHRHLKMSHMFCAVW